MLEAEGEPGRGAGLRREEEDVLHAEAAAEHEDEVELEPAGDGVEVTKDGLGRVAEARAARDGGSRARDGDRSRSEATTSTRDARVQRTRGDGPEQALLARALERRRAVDEARDDVLVRLRGDARALVASAASAARGARRGARGAGRAPRASRGPCPSCAGARRTGSATARGEAAAVGARRFRGDRARAAARRGPVRDDRRRDELVRRGAALVGDLRRPARAGARGRRRDASGARARRRFRESVRGRRATGRLPQWKDATRRASRDLRGMPRPWTWPEAVGGRRGAARRQVLARPALVLRGRVVLPLRACGGEGRVRAVARARARAPDPAPAPGARARGIVETPSGRGARPPRARPRSSRACLRAGDDRARSRAPKRWWAAPGGASARDRARRRAGKFKFQTRRRTRRGSRAA